MVLLGIQSVAMSRVTLQGLPILGLAIVLMVVHPFLNVAIRFLGQLKSKATASSSTVDASVGLRRYPLRPLLRVRILGPWHWIFVNAGGSQTVGIESNSFTVRGF